MYNQIAVSQTLMSVMVSDTPPLVHAGALLIVILPDEAAFCVMVTAAVLPAE